ncbi:MAG: Uma2 family endonuclease [Bacteroidetes bacterium]|jgi:Uma2 family endonuclease|nr:Uma2 family endonuclease [Bacteroidota bacterium]
MASPTTTRRPASWKELCADPALQDLPYKIETNVRGQLVMSPTYQYHGRFVFLIARALEEHLPAGEASVECAIRTSQGVKVADAVWCTAERWEQIKDAHDAPVAPQICVEVLSPTNTEEEMAEKRALYVDTGAEEVWLCDAEGSISFFDPNGPRESSRRVPSFPSSIARD